LSNEITILGLDDLEITTTADVFEDGVVAPLVITAQDADGDTDTGYTACLVGIGVEDGNNSPVTANHATATLTNGTVTIADFELELSDTNISPIFVYVSTILSENAIKGITGRDYTPNGLMQRSVLIQTLVITVEPTTVGRGTAFPFTVQAQDGNGNVLTGNTDTVTLTLVGAHADDKFTTPNPDAKTRDVDLVAGEWSGNLTVDGGGLAEVTAAKITASAIGLVSSSTGTFTIGKAATVATYDGYGSYYGNDSVAYPGVEDTDPAAYGYWLGVQTDALAVGDADTTLSDTPVQNNPARFYVGNVAADTKIHFFSYWTAGRMKFSITNDERDDGKNLTLKVIASAIYNDADPGTAAWSPSTECSKHTFSITLSESGTVYANGAAVRAATADVSMTFAQLNALQITAGGVPATPVVIEIELDAETFLASMGGNDVYVWISVTGPNIVLSSTYQGVGEHTYAASIERESVSMEVTY